MKSVNITADIETNENTSSSTINDDELALALAGLFSTLLFIPMLIFNLLSGLTNYDDVQGSITMLDMYYLFSDLFTMISPYVLLLISSHARYLFISFMQCKQLRTRRFTLNRVELNDVNARNTTANT